MVDICVNCNAVLSPVSTSCPSCGSPRRSQSSGGSSGGGFCGSCGTALASKHSPCPKCGHVKTTFNNPPPQSGAFCGGCGGPLASKFAPCPKCGHMKTTFSPSGLPPQVGLHKSSGTTLLLAILPAVLCAICGLGQIYVGKVGRGIGILIGGLVLLVLCIVPWFFLGMMSMSYSYSSNYGAEIVFGIMAAGFGIGYIVLLIWSIVDANRKCKMYNEFVAQNGRVPW